LIPRILSTFGSRSSSPPPAPRRREFTELFIHGYVGRICEDFGPYFNQAVSVIGEACDGFMPPEG
jgi:hypothetical protein